MAEKSIEKTYQKKSQIEHVLLRPDTYVGSCEVERATLWIYDQKNEKFREKQIDYVPALYKIFVNAADNYQRDPRGTTQIKVEIDQSSNRISVYNNVKGIPIEMHKQHDCYVPELVFGHLLTSSNYDDKEKKVTGGRNGFGAKLANIFSKKFIVECADTKKKKLYVQEFSNNLSNIGKPKITEYNYESDYTMITFDPDLKRFGIKELKDDMVALLMKRVYDLAGISPKKVSVYLNGKKITKVTDFSSYVDLYFPDNKMPAEKFYERCSERWEICVVVQDQDALQHVSFVNSIATIRGGQHVNHVTDQISNNLLEQIKKKHKKLEIKPYQIKQNLWVFINCLIENPAFDSQTKEALTSKLSSFGSRCEISDKLLKRISQSTIIETIVSKAEFKENQKLKKELGTGTKKKNLFGIPKLEDANWAGTSQSEECILILTEGDSAKSLAMSGIQVAGRDKYGVFPLKGKLLNVRDASTQQILQNEEIQNIIKIVGLYVGKDYEDVGSLRYGSIMIMADQDHDGSHIKGLLINFIHKFWPSLIKNNNGFLKEFVTPIIKASRGNDMNSFFTVAEYEKWAQNKDLKGYKIKYYKGLGTSTSIEAKEYFRDIPKHRITFRYTDKYDEECIELAFSKTQADNRKDWLSLYDQRIYVDHNIKQLKYSDFVNRELIHFSNADNLRSIPSLMDGLKPGQRKILYACFKRNLRNEIKVAQLSGYVAEVSAYHHGEVSLQQTIIGMAQDFVGSNNLNLLMPIGQFGTRMMGGKEAASARYIYTSLCPLARMVFIDSDDPVLNYQIEEGYKIEPDYYAPIIPICLVNGAEGIGTGWSTSIPSYSPIEISENIKRKLNNNSFLRMKPWYKGFIGDIQPSGDQAYQVSGICRLDGNKLSIDELPVCKWTRDYKTFLEDLAQKNEVLDIKEFHKDNTISFKLRVNDVYAKMNQEELMKAFKLNIKLNCTNMVLFDEQYKIRKYQSECEILEEFYARRLEIYQLRKDNKLKCLQQEFEKFANQYKFVSEIMSGELKIFKQKKDDVNKILEQRGFKTYQKIYGMKAGKEALIIQDNSNASDEKDPDNLKNTPYGYLLRMSMFSFVDEKLISLENKKIALKRELDQLRATSIKDLWIADLDNFEACYRKTLCDTDIQYHQDLKRTKRESYVAEERKEHFTAKTRGQPLFRDGFKDDIDEQTVDYEAKQVLTSTRTIFIDTEEKKIQDPQSVRSVKKVPLISQNESSSSKTNKTASPTKKLDSKTKEKPQNVSSGKKRLTKKQESSSESASASSSDEYSDSEEEEVIKKHVTSTRGRRGVIEEEKEPISAKKNGSDGKGKKEAESDKKLLGKRKIRAIDESESEEEYDTTKILPNQSSAKKESQNSTKVQQSKVAQPKNQEAIQSRKSLSELSEFSFDSEKQRKHNESQNSSPAKQLRVNRSKPESKFVQKKQNTGIVNQNTKQSTLNFIQKFDGLGTLVDNKENNKTSTITIDDMHKQRNGVLQSLTAPTSISDKAKASTTTTIGVNQPVLNKDSVQKDGKLIYEQSLIERIASQNKVEDVSKLNTLMVLDKMSKPKESAMKEAKQEMKPELDADFDDDDEEEMPLKRKTMRNVLEEDI